MGCCICKCHPSSTGIDDDKKSILSDSTRSHCKSIGNVTRGTDVNDGRQRVEASLNSNAIAIVNGDEKMNVTEYGEDYSGKDVARPPEAWRVVNLGDSYLRKNRFNILLLGGKGVGKTSFIELLRIYEKMGSNGFDEKELPEYDKKNTSTSTIYLHDIKYEGKEITVIDTPGIGDPTIDDTTTDKSVDKHIKEIVSTVKDIGYLNCVCIVINGTQARLTKYTKAVLQTALTILPSETQENTILLFTNTEDFLKLNFDPNVIEIEFGRQIEYEPVLCLDNPLARYQTAKRKKERMNVKEEFEKAFQTINVLYDKVLDLGAKDVKTFDCSCIELNTIINKVKNCKNEILQEHGETQNTSIESHMTELLSLFEESKETIDNMLIPKLKKEFYENLRMQLHEILPYSPAALIEFFDEQTKVSP